MLSCAGPAQQGSVTTSATSLAAEGSTDFDPLVTFRLQGVLRDHAGRKLRGRVEGMLFSIYAQQEGGAPVWEEVQNVEVDDQGRFAVMVGSTVDGGIRRDLCGGKDTLWLARLVLLPGEVEQPRILLMRGPDGLTNRLRAKTPQMVSPSADMSAPAC
jgi:hypothetical protein